MAKLKETAEQVKKQLLWKRPKLAVPAGELLSTGSSILNLACSGKPNGGLEKGKYYYFVGDSSSGKSFFTMSILAEASVNSQFDDYLLIYDDIEAGMNFDVEAFFGPRLKKRLIHKRGGKGGHKASADLEAHYDALDDLNAAKQPFIYITDSLDALKPRAELKMIRANKKAREKGNEEKGSYNTDKAKINSARMAPIVTALEDTGSIWVMISQTRDNIGFGAQYNPKTKGGGNAPTFYATLELWTSLRENIMSKPFRGKRRHQGILTRIKVKKNRLRGGVSVVDVPIYHSYGLDEIGGMVHWMAEEGFWKKAEKGSKIDPGEDLTCGPNTEDYLAKFVEENDLELDLRLKVAKAWNEIEEATRLERKPRY